MDALTELELHTDYFALFLVANHHIGLLWPIWRCYYCESLLSGSLVFDLCIRAPRNHLKLCVFLFPARYCTFCFTCQLYCDWCLVKNCGSAARIFTSNDLLVCDYVSSKKACLLQVPGAHAMYFMSLVAMPIILIRWYTTCSCGRDVIDLLLFLWFASCTEH